MADILNSLESGRKYSLDIPDLGYIIELPEVIVESKGKQARIASLNLVGQVRLNNDLGRMIAERIKKQFADLTGTVILTVVEKALQLSQVVASELGMDVVAVAYNRVKPHMEPSRRPTIQLGNDSLPSGGKFLALYERDLNLIASAKNIIILDDVVSSGGTVLGLQQLIEEAADLRSVQEPPLLAVFAVAREGKATMTLACPIYTLASLPAPQPVSKA